MRAGQQGQLFYISWLKQLSERPKIVTIAEYTTTQFNITKALKVI